MQILPDIFCVLVLSNAMLVLVIDWRAWFVFDFVARFGRYSNFHPVDAGEHGRLKVALLFQALVFPNPTR